MKLNVSQYFWLTITTRCQVWQHDSTQSPTVTILRPRLSHLDKYLWDVVNLAILPSHSLALLMKVLPNLFVVLHPICIVDVSGIDDSSTLERTFLATVRSS